MCIDNEVRCVGLIPFWYLEPATQRGLNPIKPTYDRCRPDDRLIWQPAPLTDGISMP